MAKEIEIKWLSKPEDHDYSAAMSYLSLLYDEPTVAAQADKLKRAPMSKFKAKDIFRAFGLVPSMKPEIDGKLQSNSR